MYVELIEEGYVALGPSGAVAERKCKKLLMDEEPSSEGDAMPIVEFVNNDYGLKKSTVNSVIQQLGAEGSLLRKGAGKKGSFFRYWRPEILSFVLRVTLRKKESLRLWKKKSSYRCFLSEPTHYIEKE